ncbi:hypothetical protein QFZ31_006772 [Neobacillus niacini]|nr:hypothetical protein [Neobacillus niacini]
MQTLVWILNYTISLKSFWIRGAFFVGELAERSGVDCSDKVEVGEIGEHLRGDCSDKGEARKIRESIRLECYDKLEAVKIGEQSRINCDSKNSVEEKSSHNEDASRLIHTLWSDATHLFVDNFFQKIAHYMNNVGKSPLICGQCG